MAQEELKVSISDMSPSEYRQAAKLEDEVKKHQGLIKDAQKRISALKQEQQILKHLGKWEVVEEAKAVIAAELKKRNLTMKDLEHFPKMYRFRDGKHRGNEETEDFVKKAKARDGSTKLIKQKAEQWNFDWCKRDLSTTKLGAKKVVAADKKKASAAKAKDALAVKADSLGDNKQV
jgi:hypothetical protein